MNIEAITSYDQTIMAQMNAWKKREDSLKQYCGPEDLNSREFLKLRLDEYDRLWETYRGRANTPDEKAWLVIAHVQRSNLEKALYPGLLRRMLRRISNAVFQMVDARRDLAAARDGFYVDPPMLKFDNTRETNRQATGQSNGIQQQENRIPYGPDLGSRKEQQKPGNSMHL